MNLVFPHRKAGLSVWLQALRVHQWLKNGLLFVPLLTSVGFANIGNVGIAVVAFVALCLTAAATYILDDLWDLDSDSPPQAASSVCERYIADHARACRSCLRSAGLLLASALFVALLVIVLLYVALTTTYSFVLKKYVLMDVILLALLYTYRILIGSVAIKVNTSAWLLEFSVFFFLSLALVKQCSELLALQRAGHEARGRNYLVSDLAILWPFGVGAGLSAVVVFGLFINAPETQVRYGTPQLLWTDLLDGRLWIKTSRGEMHDDPIVFAARDRGSLLVLAGMVVATLAAYYLPFGAL